MLHDPHQSQNYIKPCIAKMYMVHSGLRIFPCLVLNHSVISTAWLRYTSKLFVYSLFQNFHLSPADGTNVDDLSRDDLNLSFKFLLLLDR